jgi:hypothetical protein
MGFGMVFAVCSGHLAARALDERLPYSALIESGLLPLLKASISKRFFTSLFGSRIITQALAHGPGRRVAGPDQYKTLMDNPFLIEIFSALQQLRTRGGYC